MCIVESPNPPGVLRIELLTPGAEGRCFRPRMPAIYNVSGYRKFPCCHYRQIWKQSYVSRQCLAVQRPLVPGREEVFALRLTPEEAGER
jgi:hypothetical protein